MLIEKIVKRTIQITDDVLTINTTNDVRDKIYKHLVKDANHFDTVQRKETTQALIYILDKPHKPDNTIQQSTGINTTPYACMEIKYTKCVTKHLDLVRDEVQYRGIIFDKKTKIMELKQVLKKDDLTRQVAGIQ